VTATNIILSKREGRRILFLTDGALYNGDGILLGFGAKMLPIAHLRTGIAARGSVFALPAYASHLGDAFATFDDLIERGADVVEKVYDLALYNFGESGESEIEILVAGFSEATDEPGIYVASSRATYGRPFAFHAMPPAVIAPGPLDESVVRARGFETYADIAANFSAETDGLWLLEQQRLRRWNTTTGGEHGEHFIIGGFAQLTGLTAKGVITQQILRRWPDVVGLPITPEGGTVELAEAAAGPVMNRQQRRAAERLERKLARAD
jgi:hypothetical protein